MNRIDTSRFGSITYEDRDVILFPKGLPGFEDHPNWILIGEEEDSLKWIQSLQNSALALPVASPFYIDPEYSIKIPEEDASSLELDRSAPEKTGILVVITIPADSPWDATANMMAPIVVNLKSRVARQIVISDDRYSVWFPVLDKEARKSMALKGQA